MLLSGLELFYLAFMDLTTERQLGFGEGPIPWSKIEMYADVHRIRGSQRESLHYMVREMDLAYLKHKSKVSTVESS